MISNKLESLRALLSAAQYHGVGLNHALVVMVRERLQSLAEEARQMESAVISREAQVVVALGGNVVGFHQKNGEKRHIPITSGGGDAA